MRLYMTTKQSDELETLLEETHQRIELAGVAGWPGGPACSLTSLTGRSVVRSSRPG